MNKQICNIKIADLPYFAVICAASVWGLLMRTWYPEVFLGIVFLLVLLTAIRLRPRQLSLPLMLFAGYAFWVVITRLILRDWTPLTDINTGFITTVLTTVVCLCMLLIGAALQKDTRKAFLNLFTLFYCSLMVALSLPGIYSSITFQPFFIRSINLVSIEVEENVAYAQVFWTHRNTEAAWFMIAFFLLIRQWFACNRKIWRIPIGIGGVILFIETSLLYSRSVLVAMAVGCGMFAMLLVLKYMAPRYGWKRIVCMFAAGVLAAGISYKATGLCAEGAKSLHNRLSYSSAAFIDTAYAMESVETDTQQESATPPANLLSAEDNRNFWNDLWTLTDRTNIWKAVWNATTHSPQTMLFGNLENDMKQSLVELGGYNAQVSHGHNILFHALYVSGFPGALLLAAFLICLLIAMVRMFFTGNDRISLSSKCLILPLAALLIYGIMEPLLTVHNAVASSCFCLIAGILLADWKDCE